MKHDEAQSVFRHPLHATHQEVEHLVEVAERGESAATPALIVGGIGLILALLVATVIALALTVAYFATRGDQGGVVAAAPAHTALTAGRARDSSSSSTRSRACRPGDRPIDGLSRRGAGATVPPIESGGKSWRRFGRSSASRS